MLKSIVLIGSDSWNASEPWGRSPRRNNVEEVRRNEAESFFFVAKHHRKWFTGSFSKCLPFILK
jgi:hypothetical protein